MDFNKLSKSELVDLMECLMCSIETITESGILPEYELDEWSRGRYSAFAQAGKWLSKHFDRFDTLSQQESTRP